MTELLKKPEITSMKTGEMSDASREYYLTLITLVRISTALGYFCW